MFIKYVIFFYESGWSSGKIVACSPEDPGLDSRAGNKFFFAVKQCSTLVSVIQIKKSEASERLHS